MDSFSTPEQLERIKQTLCSYHMLPFSGTRIPGDVLEGVLAHVRGGDLLGKYDFVDVLQRSEGVGWQVKSTRHRSPLTWMRADFRRRSELVAEADAERDEGRKRELVQALGDSVIEYANASIRDSFTKYGLQQVMFCHLVLMPENRAMYYEKLLAVEGEEELFRATDFMLSWREPRPGRANRNADPDDPGAAEQLPSLRGRHVPTDQDWFAWYGRKGGQLHFLLEEKIWWPPESGAHRIDFDLPAERFKMDEAMDMLDEAVRKRADPY